MNIFPVMGGLFLGARCIVTDRHKMLPTKTREGSHIMNNPMMEDLNYKVSDMKYKI